MKILDRLRTITVSRPHCLEYTTCCAQWFQDIALWEKGFCSSALLWLIAWYSFAFYLVLPEEEDSLIYLSHLLITISFLFILASHALRRLFPNHDIFPSDNILALVLLSGLSAACLATANHLLYKYDMYWITLNHSNDADWHTGRYFLLLVAFPLALMYLVITTLRWIRLIRRTLHMRNRLGRHQDVETSLAQFYRRELLTIRQSRYGLWQERKKRQPDPIDSQHKQLSRFIYNPCKRLPRGKALPQTQFERQERQRFPYFLRCGCCIDSGFIRINDPQGNARTRKNAQLGSYGEWQARRHGFLQRPTISHLHGVSAGRVPNLHKLCTMCKKLCATSQILQFKSRYRLSHKFRLRLRDLEVFLHWETATLLYQNVQSGCHLCTLFWTSMNEEQQQILLKGDQDLESDLQRELEFVRNSAETTDVQQRFYARRSITIVVESLAMDQLDKPDLPTDFSMASKHSLQVTPHAQLIPHFGALKRPRRWMKPIRDLENALYMGESEFADPIYVVPAKVQASGGPIVMPASTSTGSDDSMELIKQWLLVADPENRRFEAPGHFVPSRLIDVTQFASTGLVRVRSRSDVLDDTSNPIYVALSHCWGNVQEFPFLVLKRSNLHAFAHGVSVKELTRTFQEAVSVTQRLGYNYLWADSLCIVQDSAEDWLQEADTMCEVYMHAVFTIAATAAWDGREGLFRAQRPLENSPCLLMVNQLRGWSSRSTRFRNFYAIPAHTDISRSREIEIMRSRWQRRAWVFQEKILSSRIVHFAERQLHFDVLNITSEDPFSQIHSQYDEQLYFPPNPARAIRDTKRFARSLWPDFVTDYTERDLSMRRDKLVAISGLVRSLVRDAVERERYVAGLWTGYLVAGLLWYVESDRHLTRPSSYPRFPSWSWASVDGRVYNDSLDLDPAASGLTRAEVVKPPEDLPQGGNLPSLGDVPEGTHVIVIGKLRKAQWTERPGNYYISRSQEFMELRGHPSENLVHNRGATEEWVAVCGAVMPDSAMGPSAHALLTSDDKQVGWFLPDSRDDIPPELYCLQIKVVPEMEEMKLDPFLLWVVRGLALTPTGNAPNEYSRVGYFELDYQSNGLIWPDMSTGPLSNRAPWLPIRRPPTIDPYGFFGPDCPEVEIKLV